MSPARDAIATDGDAMRWGEEAARQERLVNLLVDKTLLQTPGEPYPMRYYALSMALGERALTVEELSGLLVAAVVSLAVEREKP